VERVPVMCGLNCLEMADPERLFWLMLRRNVRVIRRHRDSEVVEIQVRAVGDDSERKARKGNPRRYTHDSETDENPARVWTFKRWNGPERPR